MYIRVSEGREIRSRDCLYGPVLQADPCGKHGHILCLGIEVCSELGRFLGSFREAGGFKAKLVPVAIRHTLFK